ncbi:hypothetical protein TNCV_406651 [Trichonephila clavipes]|nr:hypothetical protein TNCV_406651 [Trichonephila clavipes]
MIFFQPLRCRRFDVLSDSRYSRYNRQMVVRENPNFITHPGNSMPIFREAKSASQFELKHMEKIDSCNDSMTVTSDGKCVLFFKGLISMDDLLRQHMTATAGSDVVQSGRPIFDDFFHHLWPYIGNNTANVVFQMVKRMWLIRIDQ